MKGVSAQLLTGECNSSPVTYCEPFRTCTAHVGHYTSLMMPDPGEYMEAICGCATYYQSNNTPYTEKINAPYLKGASAAFYEMSDPHDVIDLTQYRFLASEINLIKRRKMMVPPFTPNPNDPDWPRMMCSGPSIANMHAVYKLSHRYWGQPHYLGYLDWYYLDPPPQDFCCYRDWLGFSYPARWIWHNAEFNEPFRAKNYYEDAYAENEYPRTFSDSVHAYGYIPFCFPIQVFDANNQKLGEYVGYTHSFLLNNNVWMCGNDDDGVPFYEITPKQKRYDRHKLVMGLEVGWYLLAKPEVGKTLKSPRIARTRFWRADMLPGTKGLESSFNPCKPYFFYKIQTLNGNKKDDGQYWGVNVKYKMTTGEVVTVFHSLSDYWVHVAA